MVGEFERTVSSIMMFAFCCCADPSATNANPTLSIILPNIAVNTTNAHESFRRHIYWDRFSSIKSAERAGTPV